MLHIVMLALLGFWLASLGLFLLVINCLIKLGVILILLLLFVAYIEITYTIGLWNKDGMLGVCHYEAWDIIVILLIQGASRHPYIKKPTKSKTRFDNLYRTNPQLYMTRNAVIVY